VSDPIIITSLPDVFTNWDKKSVIIRQEGGFVFVYPMLGRGVKYPDFDLRRECCLNNFMTIDQAVAWCMAKGFKYVVLR
jgi:hypothetical protein